MNRRMTTNAIGAVDGANKHALVNDIEVDDKGLVDAPTEPDLGYEIDWELAERQKVEVVS